MRQEVVRRLALAAGLAAVLTATFAGPAARAETTGEDPDIGKAMEKEYGVVNHETPQGRRLNDQLDRVTTRITRAAGFHLKSATLLGGADAKHDQVVNAFALPDGRIYVTLGLARAVQKAPNPDAELAFVVGHETTHVVKRHGEKQSQTAAGVGLAAVLLAAVTGSSGVGQLANAGGSAYVMHFSRRDEYEADKGGLGDMVKAGYPPEAAVSMLKRLGTLSGAKPSAALNGWFGTHPLTTNRVKRVQALIAKMGAGKPR